jgi:amino acid transporter
MLRSIVLHYRQHTYLPRLRSSLRPGLPHVQPGNWLKVDWPTVEWVPFLNIMFWNLNYWDSVSTLAGEVHDPSRTFPKALGAAVVLVVVSYLVPLLIGLGVTTDADAWKLGYFAAVAEQVGGTWLAWWIVAAAAVSQIGQFEVKTNEKNVVCCRDESCVRYCIYLTRFWLYAICRPR